MNFESISAASGRFLMLGKCDAELASLKRNKWSGIAIFPRRTWGREGMLSDDEYFSEITYVEAQLSNESHFMRVLNGYWVKPLTVRDIFDRWGDKKFDLIIIKTEMLTRYLWFSEQVQVHMPRFHLIEEDGHNETVEEKAKELGYSCKVLDGGEWLAMVR